ncbi:MAG: AAA family ATPase [Bacilli bacterium]|nr:AAA family ATPase [Bacilli bacterium]
MSYEELLKIVISDIPINPQEKPFGITFIAPPGIGKTTVSKILSKKTGIYITANDKIRRIVEEYGIDPEKNHKLVEQLANDRTVYMLENKTNMIIDANMQFFWESAQNNFKNHNASLYFIKLVCEEAEIIRRIKEREKNFGKDPENYSRAPVELYYKYKEKLKNSTFPEELVFYTIDMNQSQEKIEMEIDKLVEKLTGEKNNEQD